jgi:hypothetical protein
MFPLYQFLASYLGTQAILPNCNVTHGRWKCAVREALQTRLLLDNSPIKYVSALYTIQVERHTVDSS